MLSKAMQNLIVPLGLVVISSLPVAHGQDQNSATSHAKSLSRAFRGAAENAGPSVVTIRSKFNLNRDDRAAAMNELLQDPRFRGLFPDGRPPIPLPGEGSELGFGEQVGSGVVIDKSGIILTNNHVVEDADEVTVRFSDGSELNATEIKTDPSSDLAILKVEAPEPLSAARLGDSEALEIGDWVIAIGSPFELEATVSAGIISGKGRGIEKIRRGRLLQTDAAINPGNSGGALVNLDGEVIGINTAIASNSGGYQGIGFAIPINRGKWVARELLEFGKVRRAYLGIRIGELTAQAAKQLELPARAGVWVLATVPGSPADEAGITSDDVIVEFAGTAVRSPGDLQDVVEQKTIGSSQEVVVMRAGERLRRQVKMVALPDEL
ncbi:MAG: trypsin-like peptidase domain-containing protein [Planctomycetaceae bacterium]|nr:trypsin-like peptidase domain-containing protein [Planctomycetales bacterium]MCB9874669.1 trypsin-like peptidase domain-containing protein [Planctomycetaceae bacterium]MCB9936867.1 trypsin-like peptidase domain-containing protein [Planctomycetaceae bacterium]HRX78573.1 trypsin-like peptidase domain-containing protein [Pirellulaceae bacterium]